jgi:hypothetical protein
MMVGGEKIEGIEGVIAKDHEAQTVDGVSVACISWKDILVPVTGTVSEEERASVGAAAVVGAVRWEEAKL